MTNTVYPPDHLLRKWEDLIIDEEENVDVVLYEAFQAGADMELVACCKWLRNCLSEELHEAAQELRTARRPKPPSLKEQALKEFHHIVERLPEGTLFSDVAILRAIGSLPD